MHHSTSMPIERKLAPLSGTALNPMDRGKPVTKRHLVTDFRGTPLGLKLLGASWHDGSQKSPPLDAIPPLNTGRRDRPRRRPDKPHADKAYDAKAHYQECRAPGKILILGSDCRQRVRPAFLGAV